MYNGTIMHKGMSKFGVLARKHRSVTVLVTSRGEYYKHTVANLVLVEVKVTEVELTNHSES